MQFTLEVNCTQFEVNCTIWSELQAFSENRRIKHEKNPVLQPKHQLKSPSEVPCAGIITAVPVVNRGFSRGDDRFVRKPPLPNGQNGESLGKSPICALSLRGWGGASEAP